MDGDWGNILYFILMVVFVIFGVLKKKKPVNNSQVESDNYEESEILEGVDHLFDKLSERDTISKNQEYPYQSIRKEDTFKEEVVAEEVKVESKVSRSSIAKQINLDEEEDDLEFDWKQAIIAKEILDRKYI